jgi:hypothetical protein
VARKDLQVVQSGERTNAAGKPVSNIILLSISDGDYSSLRPHLEYVSLPNHLVLHEAGGKLEFAHFPNRGLISLVVVMKDGRTAEAGILGNDGFTGTLAAVGLRSSPLQAVVQISGDGFRVEVGALQNALESAPNLQIMLDRYAAIRGMQVAQTAAVESRTGAETLVSRWSFDLAFAASPQSGLAWFCFLFPLIEPDRRSYRIRLSEKTHDVTCDAACNF